MGPLLSRVDVPVDRMKMELNYDAMRTTKMKSLMLDMGLFAVAVVVTKAAQIQTHSADHDYVKVVVVPVAMVFDVVVLNQ